MEAQIFLEVQRGCSAGLAVGLSVPCSSRQLLRVAVKLGINYVSSFSILQEADSKQPSSSHQFIVGAVHLEDLQPLPAAPMPGAAIKDWSVAEVADFLAGLNLDALAGTFKDNAVDGKDLLELTDDEFAAELKCTNLQVRVLN